MDQPVGIGSRPLLFGWGARALFVGASLRLSPHRNAVAVLALGLDGPYTLSNGDGAARCISALIEPNTLHHLRPGRGRMAFLYVDAMSRDLQTLRSSFSDVRPTASVGLRGADVLVNHLRALADGRVAFPAARAYLEESVLGVRSAGIDEGMRASIRLLHERASERHALADVALKARLSPSRYRHRFVALTGVPFRRYRTWIAMGAALRCVARGASLTEAALAAGFASSSHLSTAFRGMFGFAPSKLQKAMLSARRDELLSEPSSIT